MTRTQPEKQLNMEKYEITKRGGHHPPNTQGYGYNCGCEESTRGGYAYRDKVAEATTSKAEWQKIRFYHQAPVIKINPHKVRVDTHGHGLNPTTRERINREIPRGFKIVQRDYTVKLRLPNPTDENKGGLIDVPEKFEINVRTHKIKKPSGDLIKKFDRTEPVGRKATVM